MPANERCNNSQVANGVGGHHSQLVTVGISSVSK